VKTDNLPDDWRAGFITLLRTGEQSEVLKAASLAGDLRTWTAVLTATVIESCGMMGWQAAAKSHRPDMLPVRRNEYLSLDVVAFGEKERGWQMPVAIFELENSKNDEMVAYALWKLLCVRAPLRVLFCYREDPEESTALVRTLQQDVLRNVPPEERIRWDGNTILCIGNRGHAGTFPFDFFRWWQVDMGSGTFSRKV
jgi:hypothetical protein